MGLIGWASLYSLVASWSMGNLVGFNQTWTTNGFFNWEMEHLWWTNSIRKWKACQNLKKLANSEYFWLILIYYLQIIFFYHDIILDALYRVTTVKKRLQIAVFLTSYYLDNDQWFPQEIFSLPCYTADWPKLEQLFVWWHSKKDQFNWLWRSARIS